MNILTNEQIEKVNLLDVLFNTLDVDQLRELTETEQVVARLKGSKESPGIIRDLIDTHTQMYYDLMTTRTECQSLREDFARLLRALNETLYSSPYSQEFQNLKSKHHVY